MSRDEQEIRQLVATWFAATKAGDTDTVLSLMLVDVVSCIQVSQSCTRTNFAKRPASKPAVRNENRGIKRDTGVMHF